MEGTLRFAVPGSQQPLVRRILIADGATSSRDLLRFILEDIGHEVMEVDDGEQVILRALSLLPHLMILDLHMPNVDGRAIVMDLRRIPAFTTTPIVALTPALSELMPEQLLQAGFTAYLVKPIIPSLLRDCIGSFLPS